jgi:hypothetical protein
MFENFKMLLFINCEKTIQSLIKHRILIKQNHEVNIISTEKSNRRPTGIIVNDSEICLVKGHVVMISKIS